MREELRVLSIRSAAETQEVITPELMLLGSDQHLKIICPPDREIGNIRSIMDLRGSPQWLSLLMYFAESFPTTQPGYVEDELRESRQREPQSK